LYAASALLAAGMAMPAAGWAQTNEGPINRVPKQDQPGQDQPGQGQPGMGQPGMGQPGMGQPGMVAAAATPSTTPAGGQSAQSAKLMKGVEKHISDLHRELHITSAEEPQWTQFADVMRANARAMSDSLDQRAQQIGSMNAVDDMTSYAQLAEQRSQDLVKLAAAFQTLYGTFSDQQKQQADQLFKQKTEAHAEKRAEKHAG
jgi:hypothetical protein